mmetsp:Transcript_50769/g.135810  ORF Transcript_50769/g.135810 Transcript_50769/m.135810 type:complete len:98 (-) Transcript_50769:453-746(-)
MSTLTSLLWETAARMRAVPRLEAEPERIVSLAESSERQHSSALAATKRLSPPSSFAERTGPDERPDARGPANAASTDGEGLDDRGFRTPGTMAECPR